MIEALKLMMIGMTTVFAILILVVLLGNLIIIVSNKFNPKTGIPAKGNSESEIPRDTIAAIISGVEVFTGGKGKVTTIEKI